MFVKLLSSNSMGLFMLPINYSYFYGFTERSLIIWPR